MFSSLQTDTQLFLFYLLWLHCEVFSSLFSMYQNNRTCHQNVEINISDGANESIKKGTRAITTLHVRSKDRFFILCTHGDQMKAGLTDCHTNRGALQPSDFHPHEKQSAAESGKG